MGQLWEVICKDGENRHPRPFTTRIAAMDWCEWGHVCTAYHEIRPVSAQPSGPNEER